MKIEEIGHIGVVMGGASSERDISLKSGHAIYHALRSIGCHASPLVIERVDPHLIHGILLDHEIEVVFIALHGPGGEDGTLQDILESLGVAYTGSGVGASRLAMNKILTQTRLQHEGLPIPAFMELSYDRIGQQDEIVKKLDGFPVVVKPSAEGSSIGVSVVKERGDLKAAMDLAFQYGSQILVEKFISGRELTVGMLDGRALPIIEIRPQESFFNFSAKYQKGKTQYIVPAPLSSVHSEIVSRLACRAYMACGCRDFARVDMMWDDLKKESYILEINTIPGFTETSLLPMAAREAGISFPDLCLQITALAAKRKFAKTS
jgi:D-alanine-D-alanine ligase